VTRSLKIVWLLISAFVVFLVVNIIIARDITNLIIIRFFIFTVATIVIVILHKKGRL
jgi:hypothetical protein